MNISHRSKACLLFFTGASIIALQYWSDVQAQSRLEKRIEKAPQDNLGECYKITRSKDDACELELPECNAALEGQTRIKRKKKGIGAMEIYDGKNAQIESIVYDTCPRGEIFKCEERGIFFKRFVWEREKDEDPILWFQRDIGTSPCNTTNG
jgi:hypothetical protein